MLLLPYVNENETQQCAGTNEPYTVSPGPLLCLAGIIHHLFKWLFPPFPLLRAVDHSHKTILSNCSLTSGFSCLYVSFSLAGRCISNRIGTEGWKKSSRRRSYQILQVTCQRPTNRQASGWKAQQQAGSCSENIVHHSSFLHQEFSP